MPHSYLGLGRIFNLRITVIVSHFYVSLKSQQKQMLSLISPPAVRLIRYKLHHFTRKNNTFLCDL